MKLNIVHGAKNLLSANPEILLNANAMVLNLQTYRRHSLNFATMTVYVITVLPNYRMT